MMLIDRNSLYTALARAARIASNRSTLPVLANVRLWLSERDTLTIQATDLERAISQEVECEHGFDERFDTTVNARAIADAANAMTSDKLHITMNKAGTRLVMVGDRANIELPTIPATEFPPFAPIPASSVEIDPAAFVDAAARVMIAASIDSARPVLQGVNFDGANMAAIDGFRLHVIPCAIGKAIIPARTMVEIVRLFSKAEYLRVAGTDNQWFIGDDKTTLISQVIDGDFPDWNAIEPKERKSTIEFQVQPLLDALRRVQVIHPDNNNIQLAFDEQRITITGNSEETGTAEDVIEATITGIPPAVIINARFFAQALDATRSNPVRMHINTAYTPLVFEDGSGWRAIVMPMQAP